MFLLVPAHPSCPGQSPESLEMVVVYFMSLITDMCQHRRGILLCIYVSYRCKFYRLVLVLGISPPFFGGKKLKVYNGAYWFFLQGQSPRWVKEDQENCYIYMWHGC